MRIVDNERRRFLRKIAAGAAFLALPNKSPARIFSKPNSLTRPNILWISCEDISPDLACYGDDYAVTPNLDRLAAQGCRYTNAFVPFPVCAPTRSAIITGIHPGTLGSMHMRTSLRGYECVPPSYVRCFPEYLRMAGYYCSNHTKTDYQFSPPFTTWDARRGNWRNKDRPKDAPFFSVINFAVTHESKCWNIEKTIHDPAKVKVPPYYPDTPVVRRNLARYYDNITTMDKQVGDILKKLDDDGLAESTVVFFWSDHGRGLPRCKRWPYDSGLRVPLIIRAPKTITPGSVSDELVNLIDLAPTVLSLAGLDVPPAMQGRIILGKNKAPEPKYVFGGRNRMDANSYDFIRTCRDKRYRYIRNFTPSIPYAQTIPYMEKMPIMQQWRLLHSQRKLKGPQKLFFQHPKPEEELYDLENDPHEVNNLASSPSHQQILKRMNAALEAWMKETSDLGAIPEDKLIERMWPGRKQPITATPTVQIGPAQNGKVTVKMSCSTKGASIGYRLGGRKTWLVYEKPITLNTGTVLTAKAIRIGYKTSPEIKKTVQ
ncbi:MAG: sulfatase-like hydrolase/transferase [Phycisphaerae bacterium]|nr:sulfatase-like hydrolase/transferase [Phycisphaerae bacterium]NIS50231.1 sulfatase-like hydrolase/transferase [Phycisphaerae bacterium]NIU07895.1 sulfatase-like hydrolase/transferase [Phycisphaerae bacterium]NIU55497.1 sulfatase-like hydrolase/transferase [Phycisphaerae bacterium]NIU99866.1 sulfatase-like hydrolase/transferase [Phycisphaerae bacterium]